MAKDDESKERVYPLACPNHGPTLAVRVREDGSRELGVTVPLEEGKPVHELLHKQPDGSYRPVSFKGPAQVATKAYRDHYDAIFSKQPVGQA
jgi:hypothetical protein